MQTVLRDVRYAIRQLLKTPAFTLAALITLALGIGVNAAMFSVIDQVLLRPVPYPNPDRLVQLGSETKSGSHFFESTLPDVQDWRARSHSYDAIAYYSEQLPTLGGTKNPQLTVQVVSSANIFKVLGMRAAMGRTFKPEDETAGHTKVLVLSWKIWKKYYKSDLSIIGRSVPVDGVQYTVIGVLPKGEFFPEDDTDGSMFTPLQVDDKNYDDRGSAFLSVIGRLRPGVTAQQAQVELEQIHKQLEKEYPDKESTSPVGVKYYQDVVTQNARPALFALGGAVLAVWLIACANVAGLMLTRANGRRRELAIRGALGAGRSRLMQQSLTESLVLSLGGGLLGLGIAALALKLLGHYLANTVRNGEDIHIDAAVCGYLLLASVVSAVFFGMVPAWHAAHAPVQDGLRDGTAAAGTGRSQARLRDGLVLGEIALTLVLLIAGGLMMRTLWSLRHAELGFVPEHLVTTSMFLPRFGGTFLLNTDKQQPDLVTTFYQPLLAKLQTTSGIEAAAFTTKRALDKNFHGVMSIQMVGMPKPPKGQEPDANAGAISPGYFHTMETPLLHGRFFNDNDRSNTPQVVIVNEAFAKQILPGKNPIGMQINMADATNSKDKTPPATIVGVVANMKQDTIGGAVQPDVEFDLDQLAPGNLLYSVLAAFHADLVVRTRMTPATTLNIIKTDIHDLQPDMALDNSKSMTQVIDDSLTNQTLAARLLGIFALAALLIAAAGMYGLLSYSVSQRTRELGVRVALGAQRGDVLWLVLRHALVLLGIGIGAGIALAIAASSVMHTFIYGFHGYDVFTVGAVAVILAVCGLAASYLPARRAAAVDPMTALRTE